MRIGEAIEAYRRETNQSQKEVAAALHFDRSAISRIENGQREWPEEMDPHLARLNWKLALHLADKRTGGYISNLLDKLPNVDLHPSALKEILLKDLEEAEQALEGIILARHLDPEKSKEKAKKVCLELLDVESRSAALRGVLVEIFQLDQEQISKLHAMEMKRGER